MLPIEGKRRKGRSTRRWTEDIKKWLPMSPTEAGREAQKRDVFRRMVREATSTQTCQDDDDDAHDMSSQSATHADIHNYLDRQVERYTYRQTIMQTHTQAHR